MLSKLPIDLSKVKKEDMDREILRAAIIAELDAVNLYEQFASLTDDEDMKKIISGEVLNDSSLLEEFKEKYDMEVVSLDEERKVEDEDGDESDGFHIEEVNGPLGKQVENAGGERFVIDVEVIAAQIGINAKDNARVDIGDGKYADDGFPGGAHFFDDGHIDGGDDDESM